MLPMPLTNTVINTCKHRYQPSANIVTNNVAEQYQYSTNTLLGLPDYLIPIYKHIHVVVEREVNIFKFSLKQWTSLWGSRECVVNENIQTYPREGHWKFRGGQGSQQPKHIRESDKVFDTYAAFPIFENLLIIGFPDFARHQLKG